MPRASDLRRRLPRKVSAVPKRTAPYAVMYLGSVGDRNMNSDEAQRHRHSLDQAIQNAAHSAPPGPLKDAVLAISEVLDALLAEIQKS